jgi:putative FmdB family regulatory protein
MPIYEYRCPSCGQFSEVLVQGFFSQGNPKCSGCGYEMERRLSVPAAVVNVVTSA